MRSKVSRLALRSTLVYVLAAFLWITFSDELVLLLTKDPQRISWLSMVKGFFFTIITASFLYYLISSQLSNQEKEIARRKEVEQLVGASSQKLYQSLESTIYAIASTIERRDPYTAGHQKRVAQLASAIGKELKLPESQIHGLRLAASVHDLGIINIPAEILSKPGKLTNHEFEIVMLHPETGFEILKDIDFPWPIAESVYQHHERMDGSGYPRKLGGEEILLEARIIGLSDVVEAMFSHRPYRPALGMEAALGEIQKGSGTKYDRQIAEACLRLFRENRFTFAK